MKLSVWLTGVRTRPGEGGGQCHLPQAKGKAGVLVGLECEFSACKINVDWRDRLGPDLGMPEIADSCFCI